MAEPSLTAGCVKGETNVFSVRSQEFKGGTCPFPSGNGRRPLMPQHFPGESFILARSQEWAARAETPRPGHRFCRNDKGRRCIIGKVGQANILSANINRALDFHCETEGDWYGY